MTKKRREALIIEHMPEAERIARRLHRKSFSHLNVDDVIQSGYMGLVEAARRCKSVRSFGGFAYWRVRGAIIDANRRRAYREEMNESLEGRREARIESNGLQMIYSTGRDDQADTAPLPDVVAERREVRDMLLVAILDLPLVEGAVLLGHLAGETLPEVGKCHQRSGTWAQGKLGLARGHVAEQLRRAA